MIYSTMRITSYMRLCTNIQSFIHTMLQVYTICTQTVVAWFIHFKRHIMANTNQILYEY